MNIQVRLIDDFLLPTNKINLDYDDCKVEKVTGVWR